MKYKALILDLDGTTIPNRPDGMPSNKVTEAIAKAKDLIHISVATGRYLEIVEPIINHLQLSGPVILMGGAQIIDIKTHMYLRENPFSKSDLKQVLQLVKSFNVPTYIFEREHHTLYKEGYNLKETLALLIDDVSHTQADAIMAAIDHIPTVTAHKIVSWTEGKVCINISHANATKQHGILEVAQILGVTTEEIIGVGDSYNDFPLLMACGFKVAMGNAVPELKAIADYIAPTVEDDGVADVIEKFILN